MQTLEQSIVVSIVFRLVNPKPYFIEKKFYNEKLHLVHSVLDNGFMVRSYMMAITHQYIPKTTDVETSIKWAHDKLLRIHEYCEIVKTTSKYVKKHEPV